MAVAQGEHDTPDGASDENRSDENGSDEERNSAAGRLAAKRAAKAAAKAKQRATSPVSSDVTASVEVARSWLDTNARALLIGAGAVLAAGATAVYASQYFSGENAVKSALLDEAVRSANAPIIAEGEETPEGVDESFATDKARAAKVLEQAQKAQKGGTEETKAWAAVLEGNTRLQLGKHAEARKAYERALVGGDAVPAFVRYRALEGIAFSLEGEQKHSEAAERFAQIAALDSGAYKAPAEYHRARMLAAQGQPKKAAEVLNALIKADRERPASEPKRFEDTLSSAETLLNELSVTLGDPTLRKAPAAAGSDDIMNMIRSQLGTGKGEPALDDKQLEKLVHELDKGGAPPPAAPPAPPPPPVEGATK